MAIIHQRWWSSWLQSKRPFIQNCAFSRQCLVPSGNSIDLENSWLLVGQSACTLQENKTSGDDSHWVVWDVINFQSPFTASRIIRLLPKPSHSGGRLWLLLLRLSWSLSVSTSEDRGSQILATFLNMAALRKMKAQIGINSPVVPQPQTHAAARMNVSDIYVNNIKRWNLHQL